MKERFNIDKRVEVIERTEFMKGKSLTITNYRTSLNAKRETITTSKFTIKTRIQLAMLLANYNSLFENFTKVFKPFTSENVSELANLAMDLKNVTEVYFAQYTHSYALYESRFQRGHNGLIRRYIPKNKAILDYSRRAIMRI